MRAFNITVMNSPTEQPPLESHRPWWRLHLLTWVLGLLVGGSLVLENVMGQLFFGPSPEIFTPTQFGWPFVYTETKYFVEPFSKPIIYPSTPFRPFLWSFSEYLDYSLPPLFTNVFIALVILLATIFATETYLRRQPRWQFSIQSIMVFTVFVTLLTMNIKYDFIRWRGGAAGDSTWEYIPFIFIALGLWCVFWAGWRLVGLGVIRIGGGLEDE